VREVKTNKKLTNPISGGLTGERREEEKKKHHGFVFHANFTLIRPSRPDLIITTELFIFIFS
jgi:hypothetical protein